MRTVLARRFAAVVTSRTAARAYTLVIESSDCPSGRRVTGIAG